MSNAPSSSAPAQNPSGSVSAPTFQDLLTAMDTGGDAMSDANINWSSEIQYQKSLHKLQELERRIHELREFLPQRLLKPLIPISNPDNWSANDPSEPSILMSRSPEQLRGELDQSARARITDIQQFVDEWRGADMQPIWAYVESRINEAENKYLQPSGKWEMSYGLQLESLKQQWETKKNEMSQEEEEQLRAQTLPSEGELKAVVRGLFDSFLQKDVPGVRVVKGQDDTSLIVTLVRAGIVFLVHSASNPSEGFAEWQVSSQVAPGRSPTNLENEILNCLSSRPRKWDLEFLLDMLSSYANVKQTPCAKCQLLTNNAAQLPTIRRPATIGPPPNRRENFSREFIPLHRSCI